MKVFMIGGAGAMAWGTARDLLELDELEELILADLDEARVCQRAERLNDARAQATTCDANDVGSLSKSLAGYDVCANAANHAVNLNVMRACLEAGVHYADLGGLFHVTRQQLEMDSEFRKRGLVALLGIGAAPGITSVLAGRCAQALDTVEEAKIRVGFGEPAEHNLESKVFVPPYSITTIIDELTEPCPAFVDGEFRDLPAGGGKEEVDFFEPIGKRSVVSCIHSEPATLPAVFRDKGIRHCDFKIGLPAAVQSALELFLGAGFGIHEPIQVGRERIAPPELLNLVILENIKRNLEKIEKKREAAEVYRAHLVGTRAGKRSEVIADVISRPGWCKWNDVVHPGTSTAFAVGIETICSGQVHRGVGGAEGILTEPDAFLEKLERYGLELRVTQRPA
jgi:lysine 6-dehydrogenase